MIFDNWTITDYCAMILYIIIGVISVAVGFYIKDYLQRRSDHAKLRTQLETFAGKGAPILYSVGSSGMLSIPQLYTIKDHDNCGIYLKNDLHTIFIPASKITQSEIILPCENYEKAKLMKMKEELEKTLEVMMPVLFNKMFPAMMDAIKDQIIEEDGEIGVLMGVKVQQVLKEEGYEIKKVKGQGKPAFKKLPEPPKHEPEVKNAD